MKKFAGDIIILHMCIKNHNHMMYGSWDTEWGTKFFVILAHFLPFQPLDNLENQNFNIEKKTPGDIIILHICTINVNHMMYDS